MNLPNVHLNGPRLSAAIAALAVMFVLPVTPAAQAQPATFGEYDMVAASYHRFVLPGEVSIAVLVMGSTGSPGIYEVGRGTDLGRLVALTGAALSTEANKITMRLFRQNGSARDIVYEASAEEFLAFPGAYPELQDGDILTVQAVERSRFTWRDRSPPKAGLHFPASRPVVRMSNRIRVWRNRSGQRMLPIVTASSSEAVP